MIMHLKAFIKVNDCWRLVTFYVLVIMLAILGVQYMPFDGNGILLGRFMVFGAMKLVEIMDSLLSVHWKTFLK